VIEVDTIMKNLMKGSVFGVTLYTNGIYSESLEWKDVPKWVRNSHAFNFSL